MPASQPSARASRGDRARAQQRAGASHAQAKSYALFGQATWTPSGFDAFHLTVGARWTKDKTTGQYEKMRAALAARDLVAAQNLPGWSPDAAFGILSYKSAVALRNVILTPLP